MANNNQHVASLLIEAAQLLTESANETSDAKVKKITEEIKEDVKENKIDAAKKKIEELKKWWFTTKHADQTPHAKLRMTLVYINVIVSLIIYMGSFYAAMIKGTDIAIDAVIKGKVSGKDIKTLIIALTSLVLIMVKAVAEDKAYDKYTEPELDETISYCEKKIKELEKELSKINASDPQYKAISKSLNSYRETLQWAKLRKAQIGNAKNVKDAKAEVKDAKASKDKEKIEAAKNKLKDAKERKKKNLPLSESVAELLIEAADLLTD